MLFPCLAATICFEGDLNALRQSGNDCHDIAIQTRDLSTTATTKAELAVSNTNEIKSLLASFGTKIDLSTFTKIQQLIQQKKARETIAICTEMDDMAIQLAKYAGEMMIALQQGIDSLPESIRDELQEEEAAAAAAQGQATRTRGDGNVDNDDDDDDAAAALTALLNVDTDIADMASNTRGMERVNIFTAAQNGKDFYQRVTEKESTCRDIFDKMCSVGTTIARISQAFGNSSRNVSCCEQLKVLGASAMELFKCLRLAKLVQAAAEAVGKLIQAISQFFTSSWNTFQGFLNEFDAAKRMGRLFHNLNPLKNKMDNPIIAETTAMGQSLLENLNPMNNKTNNKFGIQSLFGKRTSKSNSNSKHRQVGSC